MFNPFIVSVIESNSFFSRRKSVDPSTDVKKRPAPTVSAKRLHNESDSDDDVIYVKTSPTSPSKQRIKRDFDSDSEREDGRPPGKKRKIFPCLTIGDSDDDEANRGGCLFNMEKQNAAERAAKQRPDAKSGGKKRPTVL